MRTTKKITAATKTKAQVAPTVCAACAAHEVELRFLRADVARLQHERDTLLNRLLRVTTGFDLTQKMPDAATMQMQQMQMTRDAAPKPSPRTTLEELEREALEVYQRENGGMDRRAYIADMLHAGEVEHDEAQRDSARAAAEAARMKADEVIE